MEILMERNSKKRRPVGAVALCLFGLLLVGSEVHALDETRVFWVRDFGAIPDDGKDDMPGIQAAIKSAANEERAQVLFDAGTYSLESKTTVKGFGHENYLFIEGAENLDLVGAIDRSGLPATRIERVAELNNGAKPPIQLRIWHSKNIGVRNLVLANDPPMGSTARVVSVDRVADEVVVEVLPGLPAYDGMRAASAHAWDLDTGRLKRFGNTPGDSTLTIGLNVGAYWSIVPGSGGRRLLMKGAGFSENLEPGDGVSWHHKSSDAFNQVEVLFCEDIVFDNIYFPNVSNAGMLAGYNRNFTLRRVRFEPENGNLAVGGRDGIHLSNTSGTLLVEDCFFRGLRMDPLVVRKSFGFVEELEEDGSIIVKTNLRTAGELAEGETLRFWVGEDPVDREIHSVESIDKNRYRYTTSEPIPAEVEKGSVLSFQTYSLEKGTIRNNVFVGNFGSAIVNFAENITIEDCVFSDNAYQIKFGANYVSGAFARNIVFRNNLCEDVSWIDIARRGQPSILMIHSLNRSFEDPQYNQGIEIYGNTFRNPDAVPDAVAVDVRNATDVSIHDNQFEGFENIVNVDSGTTENVRVDETVN